MLSSYNRSASDDLAAGERVGRFNRLKDFVPFGVWQQNPACVPPDHTLYFSESDLSSLRVDLTGVRVVLARGPCLPPREKLDDYRAIPPMGPILLANVLRAHGATVRILDLCLAQSGGQGPSSTVDAQEIPRSRWVAQRGGRGSPGLTGLLEDVLGGLDPRDADVVGFSADTEGDFRLGLSLGEELRARHGIPMIIGGRGVVFPEPLIELCPGAIVVHGEGEIPLLLALDALVGGRDLRRVPSLAWMQQGELCFTHRMIHDLDVRPTYDVTGAPLGGYRAGIPVEGSGPIVPYQYGIGCPFLCGYCNATSRRCYRLRSPERIVADLENVVRRHGVQRFHMLSHLFNADRRHVHELLTRLEAAQLNIYWSDSCRPAGLNADLLGRMRRVGASILTWGVDCGSARLNRLMCKGVSLEGAAETLRASHRAGIRNVVNVIFGMPHETDRDVEEASRFMKQVRPWVSEFQTPTYRYHPESLLGRNPERYGLVTGKHGGVDEPGGLSWSERTAKLSQRDRRTWRWALRRGIPDPHGVVVRLLTGPTIGRLRKHVSFFRGR